MSYSNFPFNQNLLNNKIALVTGAGKGIGKACALSLSQAGATVIAIARTQSDLDKLSAESDGKIKTLSIDGTSDEFIDYINRLDSVDILVNNMGSNIPKPFLDITNQELDKLLNLNVRSLYTITQAVVKKMLENNTQGSIINISSQMGHIGAPNRTVYCATKHAVEGLTKSLAIELAKNEIRVNSIAPTFIETPLIKPMLTDPKFKEYVMNNIPLGKLATIEDVAYATVYLASNILAKSVTGSCMKVDGGWTAQ
ncbi:SDR family NAD(P)-dependent oxidoreductase [Francisella sp. SYW-9]|uniref:SDR family NAD(P)-dependent oxidoreductase n=1 Tax=Francisella sp. SYW-9 TaxID=2610888 RepID=UPI00123DFA2A|nr:SDR family oxidoreductase [Francisella sp. SYW-9]